MREIALTLPGAEEGTAYGTPVLRVNGHIFTGIPINKEVEPNSLGVWLTDFDQRDALIEEEPETYYVQPSDRINPRHTSRLPLRPHAMDGHERLLLDGLDWHWANLAAASGFEEGVGVGAVLFRRT